MFSFENENYISWTWKDNYMALCDGTEFDIYNDGKNKNVFWCVNKTFVMPMNQL